MHSVYAVLRAVITVLLIEDHPLVRSLVKAYLDSQRDIFVVGEAGNSKRGVDLVQQVQPNVVILDIGFSGLNGLEILKPIRDNSPKTQVIIYSIHDSSPYVADALAQGAAHFISKGTPIAKLLTAVRTAAVKSSLSPALWQIT